MLRMFVCAATALVLCAGIGLAQEKAKKGQTAAGKIKKVDAAAGILTVTVRVSKTEEKDTEFKIADTTRFLIALGEAKQELTGKDGLKNEQFKAGADVAVTTDADGKVIGVRVGAPPKKGDQNKQGQAVQGRIKKVDAAAGVLTATVRVSKTEDADREFRIADDTRTTVVVGEEKKEFKGKDGLKNEQVKEGAPVTIVTGAENKVLEVTIGQAKKKK